MSAQQTVLTWASAELEPLFAPRSIAVVGASARPARPGYLVMKACEAMAYGGRVHPVTPTTDEVLGTPCVPTIGEIDGPIDLAVLAGSAERMPGHVEEALEAGARSLLVFAGLHGEERGALRDRLIAMAAEARVPILGEASLGFVNYTSASAGTWMVPPRTTPGGIAVIAQSGTVYCEAILSDPRLGFTFSAHPGHELNVTVADLMRFALDDPATRVIGLYLETVRDVDGFVEALELAEARDVPVVAIRAGKTAASQAQIATHAARLAGGDASYRALFRRHGVLSADSSDEWWTTLALLGHERRPGPGGLAAITDSGGERALLLDQGEASGVAFARVSRETEERLAAVLSPNLSPENPVDMWDGEADVRGHAEKVMLPLVEDEATAIGLVFCDFGAVDPDPDCFAASLSDVVRSVASQTDKPVVAASYTSRQLSPERMQVLADEGIPTLDGMRSALIAVGHAFAYRDRRAALPRPAAPTAADPVVVRRWRARLAAGGTLFEAEALAMLADFGVPAVPVVVVESEQDARVAAAQAGGAVVLKTGEPITHKSEHGGVHVGVEGGDAVAAAYRDLATRLGPRVLVAPMAPPGVEIAFGVTVDQFGPVLMLAAGGTLVEVLEDRCFLLAPATPEDVEQALGELRVAALLRGVRGKPPADVAALCQAASRLSVLASELGDVLAEVDVNPMIVAPDGCVAVDAIVVPQEPDTETEDHDDHD